MLNIGRTRLVVAGLACLAMAGASIAAAQDNSSSTTPSSQPAASSTQTNSAQSNAQPGQPAATNSTNPPTSSTGAATEQQAKAPVVDPHAAVQDAAESKAPAGSTSAAQNTNANTNANASTQDWPAPQRYNAGRGTGDNLRSGQGGASLGVNVVGSEDGQGVMVARIRPGTPAQQMGLQPRDWILSLNGLPVGSVDEFIAAIRGMNAGEQIQLSIERGGNASNVGGRLAAFRETVAAGEGPVSNIVGRAREFIRDRDERLGIDTRAGGLNVQTSFEDGSQAGVRNSGDIEARLSRLEQQLERLTREIQEMRSNPSAAQQPVTK